MSDFTNIIKKAKKVEKPNKPKRLTQKQVEKRLWKECKRLIRKRDRGFCFTCPASGLTGTNAQTGHFIPSGACGAYLRYDLRNLALQCFRCNIHYGGMGAEFHRKLVEKHGQAFVDGIFRDKNRVIKARDHYEILLEQYKSL